MAQAQLYSMGFTPQKIQLALAATGNNPETAFELLLADADGRGDLLPVAPAAAAAAAAVSLPEDDAQRQARLDASTASLVTRLREIHQAWTLTQLIDAVEQTQGILSF